MKKLAILLLAFISLQSIVKAQTCSPNLMYADSAFGVYPHILPPLQAGQPYYEIVTIQTPTDTSFNFNGIDISVKGAKIIDAIGFPTGFTITPLYNNVNGYWLYYQQDSVWIPVMGCALISADAASVDAALIQSPNGGNFQFQYIVDVLIKGNPIPATWTWVSTLGSPPFGSAVQMEGYIGGNDGCNYNFSFVDTSGTFSFVSDYAGLNSNAAHYTLGILADCPWQVNETCNWVTVSPTSGSPDTTESPLNISCTANTTGAPRYCDLFIGNRIYHITQISEECAVAMGISDTIIGALETTDFIYVEASDSCYWSIINREYCDWIDISPTTGMGNDTLAVHFAPNTTNEPRYCDITINGTTKHFKQESPLSVSENKAGKLTLYPNPAADLVNINLPTSANKTTLNIYDAAGQLVGTQQLQGGGLQQISTAALANGFYLFVVQSADSVIGRSMVAINR